MKKIAIALISATAIGAISMTASANTNPAKSANSGIYILGGVGVGHNGFSKATNTTTNTPADIKTKSNLFQWTLGAGYQVNKYFALETDFTADPSAAISKDEKSTIVKSSKDKTLLTNDYSIALMAKAMYPVMDSVNVYAKAGAAYSMYKVADLADGVKSITFNKQKLTSGESVHQIVPVVGAGVSYDVTKNVGLNLDGTYAFAVKAMPAEYGANIDLSYKF